MTQITSIQDYIDEYDKATVLYDGECPVCSNVVKYAQLNSIWQVRLVDARKNPECKKQLAELEIDLNETFVVISEGSIYIGSLGLDYLITKSSNRLLKRILPNFITKKMYPYLVFFRKILLFLMKRTKI